MGMVKIVYSAFMSRICRLSYLIIISGLFCYDIGKACCSSQVTQASISPKHTTTIFSTKLDKEDNYHLKVILGTLSRPQFDQHKREFRSPENLTYHPQRIYLLSDFFPHFARMLLGKTVSRYEIDVPKDLVVALEVNGKQMAKKTVVDALCHSISWLWVNHIQGRPSVEPLFFQTSGEALEAVLDAPSVRKSELGIGDLILIRGNGGIRQQGAILHSATYVGYGVVYEKGNPGQEYPYRVAKLEDVVAKYRKIDPSAEFIFLRTRSMKTQAPTPIENLAISSVYTQQSYGLKISSVSLQQQNRFGISEEFDNQLGQSIFYASPLFNLEDVKANFLTVFSSF